MKRAIFLSVLIFFAVSIVSAEEDIQKLSVIAKRWEFYPSTITVRKDIPVKIYLTTVDFSHGFYLPNLPKGSGEVSSIKLKKGEILIFTYTFTEVGEFTFMCNVFCGAGHSKMKGKIIVK